MASPSVRFQPPCDTLWLLWYLGVQSLVPIAGNNDHALKQELDLNYLRFRAYKDGTSPLDLCMATQMLPPETGSSSVAAFSSLVLSKNNGRDDPQVTVMVDSSNSKQCPSRWLQFGSVCTKGIDFLRGYYTSSIKESRRDVVTVISFSTSNKIKEPRALFFCASFCHRVHF